MQRVTSQPTSKVVSKMKFINLVKLLQPHTTSPQKVAKEGTSPYFRKIQVGEIL